jgi:hypothetical protein
LQQPPETPPPAQQDPQAQALLAPQSPMQYQMPPGAVKAGPISVRVTNAFGVGFFAFWGAFVASLVFWILAVVVLGVCGGAAILSTLHPSTPSP